MDVERPLKTGDQKSELIPSYVLSYLLTEPLPDAAEAFAEEASITLPKYLIADARTRFDILQKVQAGQFEQVIGDLNELDPMVNHSNAWLDDQVLRVSTAAP